MSWRNQLPVSSQTPLSTLARAMPFVLDRGDGPRRRLEDLLRNELRADMAILTQSGTAALVLAIRQTVADGGTLALPAYGCADLAAAAIRASGSRLADVVTCVSDLPPRRRYWPCP